MSAGFGDNERPVPHYVVTGGRTEPSRNVLRPETLLIAALSGGGGQRALPVTATREQILLHSWCGRGRLSVAEAAAHLDMPISALTVVASDLIDSGHLRVGTHAHSHVSTEFLEQVLDGLQRL